MKKRNYTIRFGIYMFLSMVALFFIMKLFGLEKVTELRLLNILIAGYFSNKLAQNNLIEDAELDYVSNLGSLLIANLIAVFLCCISLVLYVKILDPGLMASIGDGFFLGKHLTIDKVAVAILMEGSASAIIVSFSLMQYWKDVKRRSRTIS